LKGQSAEAVFKRISSAIELREALEGAFHVQECVPEKLEFKQQIFEQMDALASPSTVLASSSSNITASKFTEKLKHRHRCLVAHPVNPPYLIPLVEIVPAPWTSQEVVDRTRKLLTNVGQAPIVLLKESNGFVLNRLQYALLAEAFRLVEDGVCSPEDVDTAVSQGLGMRWSFMGPFQTIDLNAPNGIIDYCQRYLDGIYNVLKEEDNTRRISKETIEKINNAMRAKYGLDQHPIWCLWRDQRLMAFASHKNQCEKTIDVMRQI
jgi:L-gulonate 3-dehydrogenase